MIELFYWPTPNGWKATIALEEMGVPYRLKPIDIGKGDQFSDEFRLLSPNRRMPAMIDHAPTDGGAPVTSFESGAILLYLAEKYAQFLPADIRGRQKVVEWLMWQMSGLGPMLGQHGHFLLYAPERIAYGIDRYGREARRLYGVLDQALLETGGYLAGAYSIADMACFPWIMTHKAQGIALDGYPAVSRWYADLRARPGLQRGLAIGKGWNSGVSRQDAMARLFGHTDHHRERTSD